MADPGAGWGWTARAGDEREPASEVAPRQTRPAPIVIFLVVAAAVLIAVIALRSSGGGAPPPTPASVTTWSDPRGVSLRASYIASCQTTGGSATYCTCVFATISAQPQYQTPAAFAAADPGGQRATPATGEVVAQAERACSAPPASQGATGRHAT